MELDSNFLHSQSSISCESAKSMLSPNWKREREIKLELWGWRHSRVSFKKAVSRWAVWDQQVFQEMDSEVSRQNRHTEALESLMMVWVPAWTEKGSLSGSSHLKSYLLTTLCEKVMVRMVDAIALKLKLNWTWRKMDTTIICSAIWPNTIASFWFGNFRNRSRRELDKQHGGLDKWRSSLSFTFTS